MAELNRILYNALCDVRDSRDGFCSSFGICNNALDFATREDWGHPLGKIRAYSNDKLIDLFERWPKFSGHIGFPVPAPKEWGVDASDAYTLTQEADTLWDRSTEYGRLRWELLDFLITELEKEVNAS